MNQTKEEEVQNWPVDLPLKLSTPLRILLQKPKARIYVARQGTVPREVVVKLICADTAALEESYQQEVAALAMLRHPNNVRLLDAERFVFEGKPFVFMVLEHVQGADLSTLLRKGGALGMTRAVWLVRQILYALTEAHGQGILHRDLKPSNLMVSQYAHQRDHMTVIDYGLARVRHPSLSTLWRSQDKGIVGTLNYIPPEILQGQDYSPASDLYNIGLVLYECLTGQHPFEESDFRTVAHHHLYTQPVSIQEFADFPDSLASTIERALAKHPEDRFQSAKEFLSHLIAEPAHETSIDSALPSFPSLPARMGTMNSLKRAEPRHQSGDEGEYDEIWVLDDAFSTHPQVVDQLMHIPGYRGRVITMDDYEELILGLEEGALNPPLVLAFGVLSAFVEDRLLQYIADHDLSARILIADNINVSLLSEVINRYGIKQHFRPPVSFARVQELVESYSNAQKKPLLQIGTGNRKAFIQTLT